MESAWKIISRRRKNAKAPVGEFPEPPNGPLGRDGFIKRHWIKDLKKLFKSGFPNIIYIWHLYDYINIIYIIITYYNNNVYIYITIQYIWYKHMSWSVVNWYIGRIPVALDRCAVGCESFCARCWPRSVPRTSWSHGPTRAGLVDQRNRNHMDVSEIVVPPQVATEILWR